jgi:hypothetical protein
MYGPLSMVHDHVNVPLEGVKVISRTSPWKVHLNCWDDWLVTQRQGKMFNTTSGSPSRL